MQNIKHCHKLVHNLLIRCLMIWYVMFDSIWQHLMIWWSSFCQLQCMYHWSWIHGSSQRFQLHLYLAQKGLSYLIDSHLTIDRSRGISRGPYRKSVANFLRCYTLPRVHNTTWGHLNQPGSSQKLFLFILKRTESVKIQMNFGPAVYCKSLQYT